MSLALHFYSLTKCWVGHIGGDGSRGCWRGNNTNAKQEKHCKYRFDGVETRTCQINGIIDGEATQGS